MRLVVALLFLLVFAPAAQADVTFTGVPRRWPDATALPRFDVRLQSKVPRSSSWR